MTPTIRDMLVTNERAQAVRREVADKRAAAVAELKDEVEIEGLRVVPVADEDSDEAIDLTDQEVAAAVASVHEDAVGLSAGLPRPFFFDEDWGVDAGTLEPYKLANLGDTLLTILPFALILAGVGLIESLMTLTLIDEITETRGRGNRECVGQGTANVVTGFFGGMGGCAMIGQSAHQREQRRPRATQRRGGGSRAAAVRARARPADRTDPDGGPSRRDVHGRHRHLRVVHAPAVAAVPLGGLRGDAARRGVHRLHARFGDGRDFGRRGECV